MVGKKGLVLFAGLAFIFLFNGCAFHSTSKDWNGLMGVDGNPAYYKKTSKIALNFLIMVPFIGNVSVDGIVEDLTQAIAEEQGNNVRIVQGSSENYWYGFPPFTWVVTPVVTTVSAEYKPHQEAYDKDQEEIHTKKKDDSGFNPLHW